MLFVPYYSPSCLIFVTTSVSCLTVFLSSAFSSTIVLTCSFNTVNSSPVEVLNALNEAITFKLIRLWDRWADDHGIKERRRYTLDNAEDFFAFNYAIKDLLSEIYREELQACVYNAFYQVMMPQCGTSAKECYQRRFYSYGLFGLLDEWVKRGFNETPDEMVKRFYQVMDDRSYI